MSFEVAIRLLEEGTGFVYTVSQNGHVIDARLVETQKDVASGYFGGSDAID